MATKIEQEHLLSIKYDLKCIPHHKELVKLTQDNVARVESMIRHDSDYSNSANENSETSSAHWFMKLSEILISGKKVSDDEYANIISECVIAVDRENSTHLNADKIGRQEMTNRLIALDKKLLLQYLREPIKNNYKLVTILAAQTHPIEKGMNPRKNPSFASKFCHYACMYIFKDGEEQDNFSIYDNVVSQNMPKYAKYYNIPVLKNYTESYSAYIDTINKIIEISGNEISRNGFDHLLWYFHKAK